MRRKGLFAEIEGGGKALPSFLFSFSSLENEIFFSIIFLRTFFFFIVVILNRRRGFFSLEERFSKRKCLFSKHLETVERFSFRWTFEGNWVIRAKLSRELLDNL